MYVWKRGGGAQERSWHCSHKDCFPWQDGGGHSKGEIRVEILRQIVSYKQAVYAMQCVHWR